MKKTVFWDKNHSCVKNRIKKKGQKQTFSRGSKCICFGKTLKKSNLTFMKKKAFFGTKITHA